MKEWMKYYALLSMLIWAYTAMAKPKGDTVRNLWIGYAILGAVLGMDLLNLNDGDNKQ